MTQRTNAAAPDLDAAALALLHVADALLAAGATHARSDDPHRFATLHREFDGGACQPRLVIEYRADGRVSIRAELHGQQRGEDFAVLLFGVTAQGPAQPQAATRAGDHRPRLPDGGDDAPAH